jgi:23S rRNA pseudouridine1911/1915/1917 synthase
MHQTETAITESPHGQEIHKIFGLHGLLQEEAAKRKEPDACEAYLCLALCAFETYASGLCIDSVTIKSAKKLHCINRNYYHAFAAVENEVIVHRIAEGRGPMRIDVSLAESFCRISRRKIQRAIALGAVRLHGRRVEADEIVHGGESLEILWPQEEVGAPAAEARRGKIEIIYEDEWLIAVDKPAGEVVHPAKNFYGQSTVEAVLDYCNGKLSNCGEVHRPGVVHRLDKDTTGVLLFAKTNEAHADLARQFASRSIDKVYDAVAHGIPPKLSGVIGGSIGRDCRRRTRMAVVQNGGRDSLTEWKAVPCHQRNFSHFTAMPHSGRMHQIRVHLSSIGHPILGDTLYGCPPTAVQVGRIMLHAGSLTFTHPRSGSRLTVNAQMAEDMAALLRGKL